MVDEKLPKGKKTISFWVNGMLVEGRVDPRTTLAEFLREELGLTGTKIGCNRGECGSCTILLNGNAVLSCTLLAVEIQGQEVITIEGLARNGGLHPIQEAFIEYDAVQCGYCTSGMILSVKALIAKQPQPTAEDVRTAINGNLCRCGCYPNIVKAALAASKKMESKETNNG
jgi:aerobic-type carbon monoxide dehydrogenase small subunit (CoxS/CutS family)